MSQAVDAGGLLFPSSFSYSASASAATTAGPTTGEERRARRRQRRKARRGACDGGVGPAEEQAGKRRLKEEQVRYLEVSFRKERKLETTRKVQLASELGLDPKQVAVWFQNRRARHKSKTMEDEFSRLRAAHDAVVVEKCRLENEVLRLKEVVAQMEEEREKLVVALAAAPGVPAAGAVSSPSSSSFSTVTHQPLVGDFMVEGDAAADLTYYLSEYAYNNYMMDLAAAGFYGM